MIEPVRLSMPTLQVLRVLLDSPRRESYGRKLMLATGLSSGTIYPILLRLCDRGWVTVRDDPVDPRVVGRPRRVYYRLTKEGAKAARETFRSFAPLEEA